MSYKEKNGVKSMGRKAKTLSDKYYELIVLDKEYLKICGIKEKPNGLLKEDIQCMIEQFFEWRKLINGKEDIENILNGDNRSQICDLLRISEYYEDEVYELKSNNQKDTEKYKLANKIRLKSSRICKEIYDLKVA